ncbi:hypothetical protein [Saccharibacillus alkalitolerans]|uniref:PRA1 family protein n=1 Tax=Saccharibacillus alkalitolerans TaxID=2705290 RepID=A0ABX0F657_9BACL|nr:hypothetical protein [Saccharibacillus alkalitolerans]NGZ76217.1 hypothetical protein [Saccharibacillus alkalitolerans]
MATEPNHLPTYRYSETNRAAKRRPDFFSRMAERRKQSSEPDPDFARTDLWHNAAANAVYLLGSLLFLTGEMETGSILFLVGNAAVLLRLFVSGAGGSRVGVLNESVPLLLSLAGSCFFYMRDVPPGTFLFIAGSLYALTHRLAPAVRKREVSALRALLPLSLSLIGCFFFLTSVRIAGTLLFIVSNAMLLHRSLHVLAGAYSPEQNGMPLSEAAEFGSPEVPEWVTVPVIETQAQLYQ